MWKKLLNIWKKDNLLQQAWYRSYEMLDICHDMYLEAVRILRETDQKGMVQSIKERDKIINAYQQEVRRNVITHCTLQGSTAVPTAIVLVSIIIDIERIGDYTKNIVELAANHPDRLSGGRFEDQLQKIELAVKDVFNRTRICIEGCDSETALSLLSDYSWVNKSCDQILTELVKETDIGLTVGAAVSLGLYVRWLKRTNSHLRNITTSIVNPVDRIGFEPEIKDMES